MAEDLRNFLMDQNTTMIAIKRTITNYKKLPKVNVTLSKTRSCLSDLRKLWEKAHHLHTRISLATLTEERKKLSYFLQNEFLAAEDAYNEVADYLQEAISSFVIPESPATLILTLHVAMERNRLQ
jgi:sirohydrochlorin ferrochelatase